MDIRFVLLAVEYDEDERGRVILTLATSPYIEKYPVRLGGLHLVVGLVFEPHECDREYPLDHVMIDPDGTERKLPTQTLRPQAGQFDAFVNVVVDLDMMLDFERSGVYTFEATLASTVRKSVRLQMKQEYPEILRLLDAPEP